jgi:cytochrome P450
MKVLKKMMRERMAEPAGRKSQDFFDVLIEELRREKPVMTEAVALDLMFVLLFASFETTALALTLGVKLLAENPRVLEALTVSDASLCCMQFFTYLGERGVCLIEQAGSKQATRLVPQTTDRRRCRVVWTGGA